MDSSTAITRLAHAVPAGRQAAVLEATTAQLRKDLNAPQLVEPAVGDGAFEALRAAVRTVLEERVSGGALGQVLYRVDVPEGQYRRAMEAGGLHELAGAVVLRCLQKVLTRERAAGRG
jgi:hypothetical protein